MTVLHAKTNCMHDSDFDYTYTVPENRIGVIIFRSPSEVLIDGFYVPIEENTVVVFHSGSTMSYRTRDGKDFLHDFGHFKYVKHDIETGYDESEYLEEIPDKKPLKLLYPNELSHILKMIIDEAELKRLHSSDNIYHLIFIFFNLLKREYSLQTDILNQGIHYFPLYELRKRIFSKPEKSWTVEDMCDIVHLSVPYFQYLYKQYFGISPVNDVIRARIESAKKKLLYSNVTINTIAEECGYNNLEHFSRQFKEITGTTPGKYRKYNSI